MASMTWFWQFLHWQLEPSVGNSRFHFYRPPGNKKRLYPRNAMEWIPKFQQKISYRPSKILILIIILSRFLKSRTQNVFLYAIKILSLKPHIFCIHTWLSSLYFVPYSTTYNSINENYCAAIFARAGIVAPGDFLMTANLHTVKSRIRYKHRELVELI